MAENLDLNRSFLYGDGFFESIRRKDGSWLYVDEHFERLDAGVKVWGLHNPIADAETLLESCKSEASQLSGDVVFRVTLYRQGKGNYLPEPDYQTGLHVMVKQIDPMHDGIFPGSGEVRQLLESTRLTAALKVRVLPGMAKEIHDRSAFKCTSSTLFTLGSEWAAQAGLDDFILLNRKGLLCECGASNLILLFNGQWYCPSSCDGAVQGTMLTHLRKHMPIAEASFQPEQLPFADAIYQCNSVRGIRRLELV